MSDSLIDLRSDTVTQPTPAMRAAMAAAPVGDDVLERDPTTRELEGAVAQLLGKEEALFMPSGTMSNQTALRAHTQPGDEVILEAGAHIYYYESGAPAALSGVMCRCIAGVEGVFTAADLESVLRPANVHYAPSRLVCLENTHNRGGGSVWTLAQTAAVSEAARRHGLRLHLDGARLCNASAATGTPERDYARHFDSVSLCFSKGLGAPVGSALAGDAAFIERARRIRKMLGGGMRQSGILAAGALHALKHHRARLAEDHLHARRLATTLAGLPGVEIDPARVATNIVMFDVRSGTAAAAVERLQTAGLLALALGPRRIRLVTHLDVPAPAIARAEHILRSVFGPA